MSLLRIALAFGLLAAPMVVALADTPKKCDAAKKPAACPGGGAVNCVDGEWKCHELPTAKTCDAAKKPAACPGGGASNCVDGEWKCNPLPKK